MARVVAGRKEPLPHQHLQADRQDVGRDLLVSLQKLSKVSLSAEHHVAQDQQRPAVTEDLQRVINGTVRTVCLRSQLRGHTAFTTIPLVFRNRSALVSFPVAK